MKTVAVIIVALLVATGSGAYVLLSRTGAPFKGFDAPEVFVEIPSGASTAAIGEALVKAGVVRDTLTFRVALWQSGDARRLKAGEYRFDAALPARDVLARIASGDVAQVAITFPEGLTVADMAKIAETHGIGTGGEFAAASRDVSQIAYLDPDARDLEGYLFPDTYLLPRRADAAMLVRAMAERFRKVVTEDMRARAAARGLTVRQFVTLASIVEKETGRADERPEVAAVYANRLRLGMPLQCDPTVIYALQRLGKYDGNLRRDDLQFDSPYNTYRYPGLPPGPIAAPGKAALDAVLNPADAEYLYFVSRNDGSHAFASTLDQHNRNVQQFQVRYFREKRLGRTR